MKKIVSLVIDLEENKVRNNESAHRKRCFCAGAGGGDTLMAQLNLSYPLAKMHCNLSSTLSPL